MSVNHHFSVNMKVLSIRWLRELFFELHGWLCEWLCVGVLNIKKPCWIKCFLVCNHIFLLNLILSLSCTLWLLWVHDSFQLILPCFSFLSFFFLYFTFYLMDQSNHLFSYLLLCFLGGGREEGLVTCIHAYEWHKLT